MGTAHVFFNGNILTRAENSFVACNTIRLTVNLDGLMIVLQFDLFADVTVRYAVIVLSVRQIDISHLLHFRPFVMLDVVSVRGQGLQVCLLYTSPSPRD